VRDGDAIRLDAAAGRLEVLVPEAEWLARELAVMPSPCARPTAVGMGRELFAGMRRSALTAEAGRLQLAVTRHPERKA